MTAMDEAREEPWVTALVAEARLARLGTVGRDGRPHLVPVCFARLGSGDFVIAVDEKPKATTELARLKNIRCDARVSLLIDRYDDERWERLAWARFDGRASVVPTGRDMPEALATLRAKYRQYASMDLESRPLITIVVERVAAWRWTTDEVRKKR